MTIFGRVLNTEGGGCQEEQTPLTQRCIPGERGRPKGYFRGEGCDECGNTGYKGRSAIYEVLPLWEEVQETILRGASAGVIRARAEERGFRSLQTQGFNKVTAGVTSLNEWMRVLA